VRVQDKVAVVTGGASGIGAATARLLAQQGAKVAILDRTGGPGVLRCDVSVDKQVRAAMNQVASEYGRIDILFNNAGVAVRRPLVEQDEEGWVRCFDVNVKGLYLCSKHAIPRMPPGGSIIHSSSVTGITGVRNRAAYSATKGAVVALTRNMALDYAERGIRVNCICPGFVRTPLLDPLLRDPERTRRLESLHPLGRLGEPEDVAWAVLFLASDESRWVTGQALVVDGGFAAGHALDV
jgi:NAD(P)-dependent dehydrogenase (short-subunit alcohol dehydrogenase family)